MRPPCGIAAVERSSRGDALAGSRWSRAGLRHSPDTCPGEAHGIRESPVPYVIFAAHWPYAEGGPDDSVARAFNSVTKYVATRKGLELAWKGSEALRDAASDVATLKREDGPALITQGSTDLIRTLLANDLIDEINMFTCPVVLGEGKKLFDDGVKPAAFRLTAHRVSPNGIVIARYARDGAVKTCDYAMDPPTPAEVARREKMQREG